MVEALERPVSERPASECASLALLSGMRPRGGVGGPGRARPRAPLPGRRNLSHCFLDVDKSVITAVIITQ